MARRRGRPGPDARREALSRPSPRCFSNPHRSVPGRAPAPPPQMPAPPPPAPDEDITLPECEGPPDTSLPDPTADILECGDPRRVGSLEARFRDMARDLGSPSPPPSVPFFAVPETDDSPETPPAEEGGPCVRRSDRIRSRRTREPEARPARAERERRRSRSPESPPAPPAPPTPPTPPPTDPEILERLGQFRELAENEYRCERAVSKEARRMTCDCAEPEPGEPGCGEDCLNRLLMIECNSRCPLGRACTNRRFQTRRYSALRVVKTLRKGLGVEAGEDIAPGQFLMEYVGEVLDWERFSARAREYSSDNNAHHYFMSLKGDAVIDATLKGNLSRFINHSCDPNAETQKWTVDGELRIGFFSRRRISAGDEITFDYRFQRYGKEGLRCYCEADNCRGWIGEEPDSEEEVASSASPAPLSPAGPRPPLRPDETAPASSPDAEGPPPARTPEGRPADRPGRGAPSERARPRRARTKTRPFDDRDADLEEEMRNLTRTGVKNQSHTLSLCRAMVRAKHVAERAALLGLLADADLPCRRLFLDYRGLRLLAPWCDGADWDTRLRVLTALERLPVSNRTALGETRVTDAVERWRAEAEPDADDGPPEAAVREGVRALAGRLVDAWSSLQEEFKIPKRERVELMRKHERQANEGRSEDETERRRPAERDVRPERHPRGVPSLADQPRKVRPRTDDRTLTPLRPVSKEERRREFAERVARQEMGVRRDAYLHRVDAATPDGERYAGAAELRPTALRRVRPGSPFDPSAPRPIPSLVSGFAYASRERPTPDPRRRAPVETPPPTPDDAVRPPAPTEASEAVRWTPVKLPRRWRSMRDARGRTYYYHVKLRVSQWMPPLYSPTYNSKDDDTSEEEEDAEMSDGDARNGEREGIPDGVSPDSDGKTIEGPNGLCRPPAERNGVPVAAKKKRPGLVTERIISPRKEEDILASKLDLKRYRETKERLRRRKEAALAAAGCPDALNKYKKSNRHKLKKEKERPAPVDVSDKVAQRIKEIFTRQMARVMVHHLDPYRRPDCSVGRITNTADFKHLARKLTHFVLLKELKHCQTVNELECNDSVKQKAKEFVRKYMAKYGPVYQRPTEEAEC